MARSLNKMELLNQNLVNLLELIENEGERTGIWLFSPQESLRKKDGFVGLHNLGATCYMNSILQQCMLFLPEKVV